MTKLKVNRPWVRHQKHGFQSWVNRLNNRQSWEGLRLLNYTLLDILWYRTETQKHAGP